MLPGIKKLLPYIRCQTLQTSKIAKNDSVAAVVFLISKE